MFCEIFLWYFCLHLNTIEANWVLFVAQRFKPQYLFLHTVDNLQKTLSTDLIGTITLVESSSNETCSQCVLGILQRGYFSLKGMLLKQKQKHLMPYRFRGSYCTCWKYFLINHSISIHPACLCNVFDCIRGCQTWSVSTGLGTKPGNLTVDHKYCTQLLHLATVQHVTPTKTENHHVYISV